LLEKLDFQVERNCEESSQTTSYIGGKQMNKKLIQKGSGLGTLVLAGLLGLTGCKTTPGGSNTKSEFINHIKIEKGETSFNYVTTLAPNLEVNMEGQFPISKYGSVIFYNDAKGQMNIAISAQFSLWDDLNLKEVKGLPNGTSFPMIVPGTMYTLQIDKNIWAYIQRDAAGTSTQTLAGVALQLDGVDNNFPNLAISQSFWNGSVRYSTFTIYGPKKQNGVQVPGGIFFVGDTAQAIDAATGLTSNNIDRVETTLTGPDASVYNNPVALNKLMLQVKKALALNGIVLKD
jgi:hypothetical protein